MKEIIVKYGTQTALGKRLGCSQNFVSLALKYKKNSLKAKMIRRWALDEYDGVLVDNPKSQVVIKRNR